MGIFGTEAPKIKILYGVPYIEADKFSNTPEDNERLEQCKYMLKQAGYKYKTVPDTKNQITYLYREAPELINQVQSSQSSINELQ